MAETAAGVELRMLVTVPAAQPDVVRTTRTELAKHAFADAAVSAR